MFLKCRPLYDYLGSYVISHQSPVTAAATAIPLFFLPERAKAAQGRDPGLVTAHSKVKRTLFLDYLKFPKQLKEAET